LDSPYVNAPHVLYQLEFYKTTRISCLISTTNLIVNFCSPLVYFITHCIYILAIWSTKVASFFLTYVPFVLNSFFLQLLLFIYLIVIVFVSVHCTPHTTTIKGVDEYI
jgi:hypothetical protein